MSAPEFGAEVHLLTRQQVAEMLALSPRKVWLLGNCGELPCVRIGRSVRFDLRDVEAFVESRKRKGAR